jgi:hypothetical protein
VVLRAGSLEGRLVPLLVACWERKYTIRFHMTTETVELFISVLAIFFMVSFVALLYAAYVKLELIESNLESNTIAMDIKKVWGKAGYVGRLVRLGMIFMSLLFAPYWSKRELLDLDEVKRLPRALILWVYIPSISTISLLIFMGVLLRFIGKI